MKQIEQIGIITIAVGVVAFFVGLFDPFNWITGFGWQTKETALLILGGVVAIIGLGIFVYGVNKKAH